MIPFLSVMVWILSSLLLSLGLASKIKPKVFIIDMFVDEANVWYNIPEFNLLARNITVPGFSPLFPDVHCTKDGSICQLVTGQAEINAASTVTSLLFSPHFDLTSTYFLIAGIAGINPKHGTLGSVAFARYAVQVGLQHEIDAREMPANFPTGYFGQGTIAPGVYPAFVDGTEVFEVNDALRELAVGFAKTAQLQDSNDAKLARANYSTTASFAAGAAPPSVIACDTATSDIFWTGTLLGEAFENTTVLFTNGTGVYCTSQQEDSATLGALLRGSISGLVDFSRIIVMRTGSDFDRPFAGQSAIDNLFIGLDGASPGFPVALANVGLAGIPVVQGIVKGWEKTFEHGVKPTNYVGDIFGSLGGQPDFGPGSLFGGKSASAFNNGKRTDD